MSRFYARAGHTLIEILLALGLSLVILAAAYAALDQHWRYVEAGQRQTEQMQVTRALFERLSLDLRSVVFRPDAGAELANGTGDIPRIDVVQRAAHYVGRSVGIVGDAQKLALQIHAPAAAGRAAERPAGVQSIRWEMQTGGAAASPPGTLGLARTASRETILDSAKTVSPNDLLVAEVESIRFRYFARGGWVDHWDSVERQELPRAVEVTIGFRKVSAAEQPTSGQTDPGTYRLLVPLPASEA